MLLALHVRVQVPLPVDGHITDLALEGDRAPLLGAGKERSGFTGARDVTVIEARILELGGQIGLTFCLSLVALGLKKNGRM